METLKKLRNLLIDNKSFLELKSLNSFSSTDYTVFEMTKEYFLDIFEIRLEINNDMGIVIDGLAQTVANIEKGKDKIIVSHSINNGNILIYTNRSVTKILGYINFMQ
jgi:hypothetical protein